MGNNKEIRQRMETYRSIFLVLNWIGAVVLIIVGIVLVNSRYTQGIGVGVIIGSVVLGIIGHFLINVVLAIPFILLNNGDILESIQGNTSGKGNSSGTNSSNSSPVNANPNIVNYGDSWLCKKCNERNPNTASNCKGCGAYK